MRSFLVAMILVLASLQILAEKKDKPVQPAIAFIIQSLQLSGDACSLSVKDEDGIVYYAEGTAHACGGLRTGNSIKGCLENKWFPFATPSHYLYIHLDVGLSKKGKQQWTPPFTVTSQLK